MTYHPGPIRPQDGKALAGRKIPTLAEIMADTLGAEAAASYRPSANPGACFPTALDLPRRQRVDGLIHDLNAAYKAKGHKA